MISNKMESGTFVWHIEFEIDFASGLKSHPRMTCNLVISFLWILMHAFLLKKILPAYESEPDLFWFNWFLSFMLNIPVPYYCMLLLQEKVNALWNKNEYLGLPSWCNPLWFANIVSACRIVCLCENHWFKTYYSMCYALAIRYCLFLLSYDKINSSVALFWFLGQDSCLW